MWAASAGGEVERARCSGPRQGRPLRRTPPPTSDRRSRRPAEPTFHGPHPGEVRNHQARITSCAWRRTGQAPRLPRAPGQRRRRRAPATPACRVVRLAANRNVGAVRPALDLHGRAAVPGGSSSPGSWAKPLAADPEVFLNAFALAAPGGRPGSPKESAGRSPRGRGPPPTAPAALGRNPGVTAGTATADITQPLRDSR